MQKLNLPEYTFTLRNEKSKQMIFDVIRKKYVRLTPEEWVRQNFIRFLISEKKYSPALLAVETIVNVNNNPQRADLIVFGRQGNPVMVIEFKAPNVKITQQTFDQIARYNMCLNVKFVIVSNGLQHFCCRLDFENGNYFFLPDIPGFDEIAYD
jgi:hypothetical protein